MSDELAALGFAQRAEDGRARKYARDRLFVHGADNTLGRARGTNVLIADWYDLLWSKRTLARLTRIPYPPKTCPRRAVTRIEEGKTD